jgi:hypothetical protein
MVYPMLSLFITRPSGGGTVQGARFNAYFTTNVDRGLIHTDAE